MVTVVDEGTRCRSRPECGLATRQRILAMFGKIVKYVRKKRSR